MAKIFTELSPNQRAAIGTPCRKCGVGEYRERSGKFGPWVQCSRYECGDKVHRPRGCHAPKDEPQAPAEIDQEMAQAANLPEMPETPEIKEELPMPAAGSLESTIIALVKPHIDAALGTVKVDAGSVLAEVKSQITEEIARLRNAAPAVIEIKRDGAEPARVEGAHYLLPRLIKLLAAGHHVYLWGPAGTGKTTAAMMAADALGREYELDTLDRTTFRSNIQGFLRPDGTPQETAFSRCWSSGKVYVCDEADNAPANVQNLFSSALANGHAPLAWGQVSRQPSFGFVGTGNSPFAPTTQFPDRLPGSFAFMDRLYFMHWPLDGAIEARACGISAPEIPARRDDWTCSAVQWGTWVRTVRSWAESNAPRIVVGQRASLIGLQALACGETPEEVAHGLVFRGADAELTRKALSACPLPGAR